MTRWRFVRLCILAASASGGAAAACSSFSATDTPTAEEGGTDAAPDGLVDAATNGAAPDAGDAGRGSAYRDAIMAEGPLAYWRMGARSGLVITDETADFVVGGSSVGDHVFPGSIDEVAIYAKALDIKTVAAHKTLGRP